MPAPPSSLIDPLPLATWFSWLGTLLASSRAYWGCWPGWLILRLAGATSIAAALRYHARRPDWPLRTIMNC
jgi:hypothetical protein